MNSAEDDVVASPPTSDDRFEEFPPAFGDLDVEIGPIAYGTAGLCSGTIDDAIDRLEAAIDCGMTLIDTADVWGFDQLGATASETLGFGASEQRLGAVFNEVPELRGHVVLATKGGIFPPTPYDSSAEYLRQACDASLYRLGIEVIDLYQIHEPDVLAHPAEVAEVLTELRDVGKVREVGVSNYRPSQIQTLQSFPDFPLVSSQMRCNPTTLSALHDGSLDIAMEFGMTPLAWSPLDGGVLCGEVQTRRGGAVAEVCDRIAAEQGVHRAAVMLAWLMHHPSGIIPIVGTTTVSRIRQAARATEVGLSRQQWYEIYAAARGHNLSTGGTSRDGEK